VGALCRRLWGLGLLRFATALDGPNGRCKYGQVASSSKGIRASHQRRYARASDNPVSKALRRLPSVMQLRPLRDAVSLQYVIQQERKLFPMWPGPGLATGSSCKNQFRLLRQCSGYTDPLCCPPESLVNAIPALLSANPTRSRTVQGQLQGPHGAREEAAKGVVGSQGGPVSTLLARHAMAEDQLVVAEKPFAVHCRRCLTQVGSVVLAAQTRRRRNPALRTGTTR